MMALLLALVAAMTPFVVEPDRVQAQTISNDSRLSNLTLNTGTLAPAFDLDVYNYAATVPASISSVRVTATPNIQGAQVTIFYSDTSFDGQDVGVVPGTASPSGATVILPPGATRYIGIEVTALGHTETSPQKAVYRISVTRISTNALKNANLSTLTISSGTLSPTFDEDVVRYTALVATAIGAATDFTVTPALPTDAMSNFAITSDRNGTRLTDAGVMPLSVGANVITITVTAENLVTKKPYRLTVTRAAANASDDTRLSNIRLSGLTLSPAFKPDVTTYTASARHSLTQTTVTLAVNQSGAIAAFVTAEGDLTPAQDFNPLAQGHQVFLSVGTNDAITIHVTAENAADTGFYTVVVTRAEAGASKNANLDGLTIGNGTLSPGFGEDVTSYTALVATGQETLAVTPDLDRNDDDTADVTAEVTSDKDSNVTVVGGVYTADLMVGANVITIKTTALDLVTTKTYTLTVTRAALNASDDARLSALTVGGESASVSGKGTVATASPPEAADYTAGVANDVSSIAISATPNHSGAKVAIFSAGSENTFSQTGGSVDADGVVGLSIDRNNIRIQVTAENGSTVRNYFLLITRAEAGASNNADLGGLIIGNGTLSPGFDEDVTSYTALVATTQETLTVTPDLDRNDDDTADVTAEVTSNKDSNVTVDGGVYTADLMVGANVITIKTTALDLVTTKTYTLTVTRAAANASDDAKLSALTVGGESVSVSDFSSSEGTTDAAARDHSDGVANDVSSIAISATPNHSGATVAVETGGDFDNLDQGWVVDADGVVGLIVGPNNILIEVTAENGSKGNYFLVITRALASAANDAKLDTLTLSGITFSPGFDSDIMMYSAVVPENIAATTVTATGADEDTGTAAVADGATSVAITSDRDDDIDSDGNPAAHIARHTIELSPGTNVITIVVTAADYETMETYTVRVSRGASSNATLSSLSLMDGDGMAIALMDMDGMTAEFMADTMMYYASVDAGVDMIEVMATAMDSDATVSGDGAVSLDVGENTITVTVTAEDGTTTMTYTVTVTVLDEMVTPSGTLLDRYDADDSGDIDLTEVSAAIDDYFDGQLTLDEVSAVIDLYFG